LYRDGQGVSLDRSIRRRQLPTYLDHHAVPQLTPEQTQQAVADMKAGKITNGVKGLSVFIGKNDAWCLTEAPNPQVVHDIHKSNYGLELGPGDVTEVQILAS
jgi:hypothetical protein